MKKIEIFDPVMCCPTGVCGPSVDPELARVASVFFLLEKKGVDIHRYNLGNEPQVFVCNPIVNQLLQSKGVDALPIILADGQLMKEGSYPTTAELASWTGLEEKELIVAKPSSKTLL